MRRRLRKMYNAYFGLSENPFNLSPDPAFFYRSPQHEESLANLIYGIQSRKGFTVLTGEVGTGKTTLLECLRDELDAGGVQHCYILNPRLTVDQFLEMIAHSLDLRTRVDSKAKILIALEQLLLQRASRDAITALVVDEAHDLGWDVLEEIRLLGNLETRAGKLLQIVLVGQPELDRKLDAPNLRQLKQRVVLRCTLRGLTSQQTADYVCSRLAKAGLPGQTVFSPEVLAEVHTRTQGIPRLINTVCDNLLLTAFALEEKTVSAAMLDEVSVDLRLDWPGRMA
jgi:general secretion pathway protein A